jgi:hypothetical protein
MHQNYLISFIVDPTPSRFVKKYPQSGSQLYTYIFEDFRDKINFFLNWFTIEKYYVSNDPIMMCNSEKYFFIND